MLAAESRARRTTALGITGLVLAVACMLAAFYSLAELGGPLAALAALTDSGALGANEPPDRKSVV